MPKPVGPYAIVEKYTLSEANVTDFGHCFSERPAAKFYDPAYTFTGFTLEPNTDTVITTPELSIVEDNGVARWNIGSQVWWTEAYPSGYPQGRKVMKWWLANPEITYIMAGKNSIAQNVPWVLEMGLLPSAGTETAHTVNVYWAGTSRRLTFEKGKPVKFYVKDGTTWVHTADVPLLLKHAWRDIETDFIWVVPYYHGVLFSTSPDEGWHFVRTADGLDFPAGQVQIIGSGGVSVFATHDVSLGTAQILSDIIDPGAEPENEADLTAWGWLGDDLGGTVTLTKADAGGPTYRYQVDIEPGAKVLGVGKVDVDHKPALTISREADPYTVNYIHEVNEQIPEDPTEESCVITLDNTDGDYTDAFKRFDTVDWHFGWLYDDGHAEQSLRNTGIVTAVRESYTDQQERTVELTLRSPLQKVKDGTVIFCPDYTGWLVSEAVTDFLMRHGIPEDRISVEDHPLWETLTLPAGGDQGTWQPAFGDSSWKWLEDLVYYFLGGWILSQRDGTIRIERYPDPDDWATWTDIISYHTGELESLVYGQYEDALEEVRNIIVVQGLSPDGYPLAAVKRDEGSLSDPAATNYIGYPKPLVVRDAGLSTQDIVSWVCDTLYTRYRKLRSSVEFTTLARKGYEGLYPGMGVRLWHSDGTRDMVLVRSVSTRLAHGELQQTVYGHYVQV